MVEKSHPATGLWPSLYDPFSQMRTRMSDWLAPASDASTDDNGYRISMELPGVAEGDVDVSVENNVVTVRGEKKSEREEKGETWYFTERQYGGFSRSFRLPPDADDQNVAADLKDGVLTISVPKAAQTEAKGRKVKIGKAGDSGSR